MSLVMVLSPCWCAKLISSLWPVQHNPLDPECEAEGKVVCSQGHIKGQPGITFACRNAGSFH